MDNCVYCLCVLMSVNPSSHSPKLALIDTRLFLFCLHWLLLLSVWKSIVEEQAVSTDCTPERRTEKRERERGKDRVWVRKVLCHRTGDKKRGRCWEDTVLTTVGAQEEHATRDGWGRWRFNKVKRQQFTGTDLMKTTQLHNWYLAGRLYWAFLKVLHSLTYTYCRCTVTHIIPPTNSSKQIQHSPANICPD